MARLATRVAAARRAFLARDPTEDAGTACMLQHTDLVDEALRDVFTLAVARARATHGEHCEEGVTEAAIVATGGYGRRELAPFSDIDVAFVPCPEDNPYVDAVISNAFRLLVAVFLDATDYEVGYAYRPLSDLATLDHPTQTALLDARLVVGSWRLFRRLQSELRRHLDVVTYLQHKAEEQLTKSAHLPTSVYSVQPDLKEGPGGLRDIQSALWMAQVRFGLVSRERALELLIEHGVVSANECQALRECEEYLRKIRTWLHLHAQCKQDVVLPEVQGVLGRDFGFRNEALTAGQQFMRAHYRRAARIHRFAAKVSRELLGARLPLSPYFVVVEGRLRAVSSRTLAAHPEQVLFGYRLAQQYRLEFHPELDRQIEEATPRMPPGQGLSTEARRTFLDLLAGSLANPGPLLDLAERGVLERVLPEMGDMLTLVPADPAHEVTVGAHALRVVERLAELAQETAESPPSLPAQVLGELADPGLLVLAGLLHDVGKLTGPGDHAATGAARVEEIAARFPLDAESRQRLVTLVREHLTLTRASRLLNLDDPVTIREAVAAVGDLDTLKALYLLSHADTRAVGTGAYTRRDLSLLDELYLRLVRHFTAASPADLDRDAARRREEVSRELAATRIPTKTVARLCEALPPGYLLNTPLHTVAAHAAFLDQLEREGPVIDLHNPPGAEFTELTVCTYDAPTPGLLSRIAGGILAVGGDIHSAQVFTIEGTPSVVLDTLWISADDRPLSERRCRRLTQVLEGIIAGTLTLSELLRETGTSPPVRPEIHGVVVSNDLSDTHTVIRVTAENIPGLLFLLTHALSELHLDIHVAKITTWAGRAEDSFYVTTGSHEKLPPDRLSRLPRQLRVLVGTGDP